MGKEFQSEAGASAGKERPVQALRRGEHGRDPARQQFECHSPDIGGGRNADTNLFLSTIAPVDLIGARDIFGNPLVLEVGSTYQARFVAIGVQAVLKALAIADGTPVAASDAALPVLNFEHLTIIPKSSESIFVWSDDAGHLVINDVP